MDQPSITNCSELKDSKGQKFLFLNVRSVFNNLSKLQADFNNSNFVAIGFTETWLHQNILSSMISINGFKPIRLDRQIEKHGGGIMIYLREDCSWDLVANDSMISNENLEILSIVVHRRFFKDFCLSVAYIPPSAKKLCAIGKLDEIANIIY